MIASPCPRIGRGSLVDLCRFERRVDDSRTVRFLLSLPLRDRYSQIFLQLPIARNGALVPHLEHGELAAGCRDAAEDRRGSGRATGSFPVRAEQVSESAARTAGGAAQPQERAVVERTTGPVRGGLEGAGYGRRTRRQRGRR